ncbi:Amino acid transporter, partial [Oryctes borbonicus]
AYVPIRVIWDVYLYPVLKESKRLLSWEYLLRVAVVTMSVFFAATLPMLGLFMSLFGAITISHMGLVFPGILDFCTRYPDNYGPLKIYKYRDIFLIVYGYIGLITGLVIGLIAVVKEYQEMYGK